MITKLRIIDGGKGIRNTPSPRVKYKYDRKQKNQTRDMIFKNLGQKRSILTLPSDGALCSQALETANVITKNTHQQWVEHNGSVVERFPKLITKLGYTNVKYHHGSLEDYEPTRKIDLLNADMESSFTLNLGLAFEERLSKWFMDDTTIILWLTIWARNPATADFHKWFEDKCREPGRLRDYADYTSGELDKTDPSIILPIVLLSCAMRNFTFQYNVSKAYNDRNTRMIVFRFDQIYQSGHVNMTLPSFNEIVDEFRAYHHREYNMSARQKNMLSILVKHFARSGKSIVYDDSQWWILNSNNGRLACSDHIENLFELHIPQNPE